MKCVTLESRMPSEHFLVKIKFINRENLKGNMRILKATVFCYQFFILMNNGALGLAHENIYVT